MISGFKDNVFLAGTGTKGVFLAPLAGMAIENRGKEYSLSSHPEGESQGDIRVKRNFARDWYCPLCGDHNTDDHCKAKAAVCFLTLFEPESIVPCLRMGLSH